MTNQYLFKISYIILCCCEQIQDEKCSEIALELVNTFSPTLTQIEAKSRIREIKNSFNAIKDIEPSNKNYAFAAIKYLEEIAKYNKTQINLINELEMLLGKYTISSSVEDCLIYEKLEELL